ncbi:MAG: HPr kinase/phosphorylase [Yoonia sp.]|jgi:HPr kinase/phosphorylase
MTSTIHATCVSWHGKAVLITGQSGSGKSGIGLQLMALGCDLIADDRTSLEISNNQLIASCPLTLAGLIEARGIGILNAGHTPSAAVALVVDLNQTETARLPQQHVFTVLGCGLPLIWRVDGAHFVPAILQILKSGWSDR